MKAVENQFKKYQEISRNSKYKLFIKTIRPKKNEVILDLGGAPGIYLEELNKATDQKTDQALSKMRDHIESGNIDLAISAAKDLNNN
ncbi:hypothetical protein J4399_05815, partial [Candidatus Woesearchaeota archaeon]|nr:hypothetical protein [Candidatus Woesearchaeota archaeon]